MSEYSPSVIIAAVLLVFLLITAEAFVQLLNFFPYAPHLILGTLGLGVGIITSYAGQDGKADKTNNLAQAAVCIVICTFTGLLIASVPSALKYMRIKNNVRKVNAAHVYCEGKMIKLKKVNKGFLLASINESKSKSRLEFRVHIPKAWNKWRVSVRASRALQRLDALEKSGASKEYTQKERIYFLQILHDIKKMENAFKLQVKNDTLKQEQHKLYDYLSKAKQEIETLRLKSESQSHVRQIITRRAMKKVASTCIDTIIEYVEKRIEKKFQHKYLNKEEKEFFDYFQKLKK